MFRKLKSIIMTHLAFVVSRFNIARWWIQNEEIGQLLAVLGGEEGPDGEMLVGDENEKLLRSAAYVEEHTIEEFLKKPYSS